MELRRGYTIIRWVGTAAILLAYLAYTCQVLSAPLFYAWNAWGSTLAGLYSLHIRAYPVAAVNVAFFLIGLVGAATWN